MPAMRCSDCGINFPTEIVRCRGCGHRTDPFMNGNPDLDWDEKGKAVRCLHDEASRPTQYIVPVDGKITVRDGNYFIDSREVCRSGFQSHLEPDTLIQVGHQIFEIGGYSESRREYWLILFDAKMTASLV